MTDNTYKLIQDSMVYAAIATIVVIFVISRRQIEYSLPPAEATIMEVNGEYVVISSR